MGLTVTNLSSEKAEAMSYEKRRGVLVKHVENNSPAERAGISPGDVILKVGSKDVNSAEEFKSVLNEFTERGLSVSVFVKSKGKLSQLFFQQSLLTKGQFISSSF